jgi:signal transduction histidine kinase
MSAADVDTSDQSLRRALLIERLAAVGTLSEGLAHELHNPLNCALLQLAVLQRRLEQPDCRAATVQPVVELVEQALRRLELLFNDLIFLLQLPPGDGRLRLLLANLAAAEQLRHRSC